MINIVKFAGNTYDADTHFKDKSIGGKKLNKKISSIYLKL
uniref:Uncharacterized protein n=1 Tax=Promethearchaeum syntrophicum TaxID=2594042 RepID=A0A5B9DC13_9ARCH|nr:hypothetical protein DSAG12_02482 [Candidatus Prometheoarchaeum syntrophicum]